MSIENNQSKTEKEENKDSTQEHKNNVTKEDESRGSGDYSLEIELSPIHDANESDLWSDAAPLRGDSSDFAPVNDTASFGVPNSEDNEDDFVDELTLRLEEEASWEKGEIINPFTFSILDSDDVRKCLAKIMPWVFLFALFLFLFVVVGLVGPFLIVFLVLSHRQTKEQGSSGFLQ